MICHTIMPKTKVALTLDSDLLKRLDELVELRRFRNRSQAVFCLEALAQCVERAGADVSVDDTEREDSEFCEATAARTSFEVSTDLRDL